MFRSKFIVPVMFLLGLFSTSCEKKGSSGSDVFSIVGDTIDANGAVDVNTLPALLDGYDSFECKLRGEINAVCQTKGCWMTMPISEDEDLLVRFKDYGFFVPKNSSGHNGVIEGIAYVDTIDVAERKHLAQDEGLSEEEIAAIDQPEIKYTFMARGVIIE